MAAGRIASLDGLRGLASLVVLVHHVLLAGSLAMCAAFLGQTSGTATELLAQSPLRLVWAGHEAVRVFFVLSGFVLVLPYAQGRAFRAATYYPSRLLRLYLPAIAALLIAAALHAMIGWKVEGTWWLSPHAFPLSLHGFLKEATLVQNNDMTAFPMFTAIWSLKWEVWFSLALPLCVWAVAQSRAMRAAVAVASVAAVSYQDQSNLTSYLPLFTLGAAAAYELPLLAAVAARVGRAWSLVFLAGAVLITSPSWLAVSHQAFTVGIQTIAGLALVVGAATGAADGLLGAAPVRWLGKRAFSLYLIHEPLIVSTAFVLGANGPLATYMVVAIPIALLGAELFYRGIERPSHQLARRIGARPAARAPEPQVAV